jgi:hypothetical protein
VKVRRPVVASTRTLPFVTGTTVPAVTVVEPIWVNTGVPSKESAVAPLVPAITSKVMALSSWVVTESAVMSATAVTVMATLSTSVRAPPLPVFPLSFVVSVNCAAPL